MAVAASPGTEPIELRRLTATFLAVCPMPVPLSSRTMAEEMPRRPELVKETIEYGGFS